MFIDTFNKKRIKILNIKNVFMIFDLVIIENFNV